MNMKKSGKNQTNSIWRNSKSLLGKDKVDGKESK